MDAPPVSALRQAPLPDSGFLTLPKSVGPTTFRTLQFGGLIGPRHDAITGAQRYFFDLLRTLPAAGVSAHGVLIGELAAHDRAGVTVETIAPIGTTRRERVASSRRAMTRLLPQTDLVVSHFAPHAFTVLDQIRRSHALVMQFHGAWTLENLFNRSVPWTNLPLTGLQELTVYNVAARVITLFTGYARVLERVYRVAPEAIRVVPGGVDLRHFRIASSRRDARRFLGWPLDRPIVTMVGRVVRYKGIDRVIDAVDLIRRHLPDVLFVIAGSGVLAPALKERVRAAGLERWVRFVGHIAEELPHVYRAADLTLATSYGPDGFGLVVAESAACGTPVLLVPIGGIHAATSDPALRYVPGRRSEDVAATVIEALTGRMSLPSEDTCLAFARQREWSTIAARIRDVYAEALA